MVSSLVSLVEFQNIIPVLIPPHHSLSFTSYCIHLKIMWKVKFPENKIVCVYVCAHIIQREGERNKAESCC